MLLHLQFLFCSIFFFFVQECLTKCPQGLLHCLLQVSSRSNLTHSFKFKFTLLAFSSCSLQKKLVSKCFRMLFLQGITSAAIGPIDLDLNQERCGFVSTLLFLEFYQHDEHRRTFVRDVSLCS